jgi:hypothetical protein
MLKVTADIHWIPRVELWSLVHWPGFFNYPIVEIRYRVRSAGKMFSFDNREAHPTLSRLREELL